MPNAALRRRHRAAWPVSGRHRPRRGGTKTSFVSCHTALAYALLPGGMAPATPVIHPRLVCQGRRGRREELGLGREKRAGVVLELRNDPATDGWCRMRFHRSPKAVSDRGWRAITFPAENNSTQNSPSAGKVQFRIRKLIGAYNNEGEETVPLCYLACGLGGIAPDRRCSRPCCWNGSAISVPSRLA